MVSTSDCERSELSDTRTQIILGRAAEQAMSEWQRSTVRQSGHSVRTVLRCCAAHRRSATRAAVGGEVYIRQFATLAIGWRDHPPSRGSMRADAVNILAASRDGPQCCLLSNRGISDVREDVDLAVTPYAGACGGVRGSQR